MIIGKPLNKSLHALMMDKARVYQRVCNKAGQKMNLEQAYIEVSKALRNG